MFTQEVRRERAAVDLQLVRQLVLQTSGVERRARADDLILRIVQLVLDIFCDDIAWIGDRDDDPVKAGLFDERQEFLRRRDAAIHHIEAGLSRQTRLAGCIDHDVCILHVIDRTCIRFEMMRLVADRIHQVEGFAHRLVIVHVVENDFIRQPLYRELQSQMRANIAGTDDSYFSCLDCHILLHSFASFSGIDIELFLYVILSCAYEMTYAYYTTDLENWK